MWRNLWSSAAAIMIILYDNIYGGERENDAVPQKLYPNTF